jgi:LysR family transcriptional activator of mexEF-oprN operon
MDLNLLLVFHCLMTERSVTRVGTILHLTQGAISSALRRLRDHFDDELFTRTSAGMVPTRRALEIAPQVTQALTAVSTISQKGASPPTEQLKRTFNIGLSDDLEGYLSPKLVDKARMLDVGSSFAFHQTNSSLWKKALADADIDLVLCSEPKEMTSQYSAQVLFSSSYSCLYDGPRLRLQNPITREEYLSFDHVRISFDGRRGFVDDLLEKEGIPRRVVASFTHFAGLVPILAFGSAIATMPTFAARVYARMARLSVSPVPIYVPAFRIFMIWNVRKNADLANQWLRRFVVETTQELQNEVVPRRKIQSVKARPKLRRVSKSSR